jgi:hypothetical protein
MVGDGIRLGRVFFTQHAARLGRKAVVRQNARARVAVGRQPFRRTFHLMFGVERYFARVD